jgi:hypothetical protein
MGRKPARGGRRVPLYGAARQDRAQRHPGSECRKRGQITRGRFASQRSIRVPRPCAWATELRATGSVLGERRYKPQFDQLEGSGARAGAGVTRGATAAQPQGEIPRVGRSSARQMVRERSGQMLDAWTLHWVSDSRLLRLERLNCVDSRGTLTHLLEDRAPVKSASDTATL